MALSLGTLFVKLNADPSALVNGLNSAATKIDQFGQRLNQTSEKLTKLGMALSTVGIAAVATAAQFDDKIKRAVDELKNTFQTISVEIGSAFMPAMRVLNEVITVFANILKNLSPETKSFIGSMVAIGGMVLLAGGAVTKLIALFAALAPMLSSVIGPALAFIAANFGLIAGVILGVVSVAVILANEWDRIVKFLADSTRAVGNFIMTSWETVKNSFKTVFNWIGEGWKLLTKGMFESFRFVAKFITEQALKLGKVFGVDLSAEIENFNKTIDDIADAGFKPLIDAASDAASNVGSAIKTYVGDSWEWTTSKMAKEWDFVVDYTKRGLSKIAEAAKSKIGPIFEGLTTPLEKLPGIGGAVGAGQPAKTPGKTAETMKLDEIEVVGKMGKKVEENAQATQSMSDFVTGQILQTLGDFGTLFQVIQRGLEVGGPIGAIVGALIYLVGRSKAFGELVKQISAVLDVVSEELGTILAPLFMSLAILLKALVPVISGLLKWIGAPLFYAFKLFGTAIGGLAYVIAVTWNAIVDVTAYIFEVLGHALNAIWKGLGDANIATANYIRAQKANTQEMYQMLQEFEKMDFFNRDTGAEEPSPIDPFNDSIKNVTNSLNELNESLTNVPAGFKVAAARFNATQANGPFSLGIPSFSVQVLLDGRQIYSTVKQQENAVKFIRFNRFSSNPPKIDWSQFLP